MLLFAQLSCFVAKKKLDDKSKIVVGGIITFIARKMEVGAESGLARIERNFRLDLDTLTFMFFMATLTITNMNGKLIVLIV